MRVIASLVLSIFVAACAGAARTYEANAVAPACVKAPPPTDEQIRNMSTAMLYRWCQASREAADLIARGHVLNVPPDPCLVALTYKHDDIVRELKFR